MISLHFTDAALLADELAGFGPEVLVRSPDHLVEAVKARLRLAVDAHSDESGGDSDGH